MACAMQHAAARPTPAARPPAVSSPVSRPSIFLSFDLSALLLTLKTNLAAVLDGGRPPISCSDFDRRNRAARAEFTRSTPLESFGTVRSWAEASSTRREITVAAFVHAPSLPLPRVPTTRLCVGWRDTREGSSFGAVDRAPHAGGDRAVFLSLRSRRCAASFRPGSFRRRHAVGYRSDRRDCSSTSTSLPLATRPSTPPASRVEFFSPRLDISLEVRRDR